MVRLCFIFIEYDIFAFLVFHNLLRSTEKKNQSSLTSVSSRSIFVYGSGFYEGLNPDPSKKMHLCLK